MLFAVVALDPLEEVDVGKLLHLVHVAFCFDYLLVVV